MKDSNGLNDWNTYTLDYELDVLGCYDGATSLINRSHTRTDALNLTNVWDNVTPANNQSYWYTASNRLQNANGPWGAKTFYYDGVGNRTSEIATPPGGSATTDILGYPATSNRVVQITRGGATVRQMTYDNAGNLVTDNKAGSTTTYTYNKRNRMASATSGALVWGYTYNGLEQLAVRTLTTGGTDVSHFIHDLWGNVIAETGGGGATGATGTLREYIWLPETEIAPTASSRTTVDRPLAVVEDVETASPLTWWVSADHLNRPVKMTNAAKASVWDAVWQPWGGVHSITGTGQNNLRFPGQWFQLETGLHYNWHRSYDPTLGRYTQPDPLGFVDGPSVYGYAGGSPLAFVDLSGLDNPGMGPYSINPILSAAYQLNDKAKYCYSCTVGRFGPNTNKCNKWLDDVLRKAGLTPPTRWGGLGGPVSAGTWGDPSVNYRDFPIVQTPQPGDIVAIPYPFTDASGHVAIVDVPNQTSIGAGGSGSHTTGWPWNGSTPTGTPVYRRPRVAE